MKKISKVFLSLLFVFATAISVCLSGCDTNSTPQKDYELNTFYLGKLAESTDSVNTHFLYFVSDDVLAFGIYDGSVVGNIDSITDVKDYCYDVTKVEGAVKTTYHAVNQAEENRVLDIYFENVNKATIDFRVLGDPTIDTFILTIVK